MPLHLAHHKSYHPYNRENFERVRRDEEAARLAEEQDAIAKRLGDSEATVQELRRRRGVGGSDTFDNSRALENRGGGGGWDRRAGRGGGDGVVERSQARLRAAEAEIAGRRGALQRHDDRVRESIGAAATTATSSPGEEAQRGVESIVGASGHINLWAHLETQEQARPSTSARPGPSRPPRGHDIGVLSQRDKGGVASAARALNAKNKAERGEGEDDPYTMYLSRPAKELHPWYQDARLESGEEKRKSDEQRLEELYREGKRKRDHDPLRIVALGLQEREREGAAEPSVSAGARHNPQQPRWPGAAATSTTRGGGGGGGGTNGVRPPPPHLQSHPSSTSSSSSRTAALRAAAEARETSERARAEALIAARQRQRAGLFGESPTPNSGTGFNADAGDYSDQFNRDDVRAARMAREERMGRHKPSSSLDRDAGGAARRDFRERPPAFDPGGTRSDESAREQMQADRDMAAPMEAHTRKPEANKPGFGTVTAESEARTTTAAVSAASERHETATAAVGEAERLREATLEANESSGTGASPDVNQEEKSAGQPPPPESSNLRDEDVVAPESAAASSQELRRDGSRDSLNSSTSSRESGESNGSDGSTRSTSSAEGPRESMYPVILGRMIDTVLDGEEYLFSPREKALLRSYSALSYPARFLISRLVQRKQGWLRLDRMNYSGADCEDVGAAAAELSQPITARDPTDAATHVVPLAKGQDDADKEEPLPLRWCQGVEDMVGGEEEAMELLTLDELKVLAKQMGVAATAATRAAITKALLTTRSQATLLGFASAEARSVGGTKRASTKSPAKDTNAGKGSTVQTTLNFGGQPAFRKASQAQLLRTRLAEVIGGCVCVAPQTRALVERVALVYYRGSVLGSSALTTAVLAYSRRRNYPRYAFGRSKDLFASRAHLLDVEEALAMEAEMDRLLEWDGTKEGMQSALALFERAWPRWEAAVREMQAKPTDEVGKLAYHRMRFHPGWPLTRIVYKGTTVLARFKLHDREAEVLRALLAQRYFRRGRRGDWYDRLALVTALYDPDAKRRKMRALEVAVQGIEDPDTHLIYHDALQRRIVRLENQLGLPFSQRHDFSYARLAKSEERVFEGVRLDAVVTPDEAAAARRTGLFGATRPEPPLPTANRERKRGRGATSPTKPDAVASATGEDLAGFTKRKAVRKVVRVEQVAADTAAPPTSEHQTRGDDSVRIDTEGVSHALGTDDAEHGEKDDVVFVAAQTSAMRSKEDAGLATTVGATTTTTEAAVVTTARRDVRTSLATVWRGLDMQPCRVETLVLQHYAAEGYKGYHCEGGVLRMLFTLAMWDVLFLPIEGAFETQYQGAPLDLQEDSFAIARAPEIRARLHHIERSGGLDVIGAADERERPRRTWAIGCRWDAYPREDLLEVAKCIGGHGLSVIFQALCEEFAQLNGGGGMPDLVVWRMGDARVRFCEVKSPLDRLSDKQRVWMHVLSRAGVRVEVGLVRPKADPSYR